MRITFFRRKVRTGHVFPFATTRGAAAQMTSCIWFEFSHGERAAELVRGIENVLSGEAPSVAFPGEGFELSIDRGSALVECNVDGQYPRPYRISTDALLKVARAWLAFLRSDNERGAITI